MNVIENLCNKKYAFPLLLLVLFIYMSLLSLQGFDLWDSGFCLSGYQQVFNDPSSCELNFSFYLSELIGGFFNFIFPSGGIFYFRILNNIVLLLCVVIAYYLLKDFMPRSLLFIGMAIYIVYNCSLGVIVLHHNCLSQLFALLAVFFLMKGLRKDSLKWFCLSGLILGLNVFIRLPNVTLFILFSMVLLHAYCKKIPFKTWIGYLAIMIFGALIGVLCVIGLLYFFNHGDVMKNSLENLFLASGSGESSHSLKSLLRMYSTIYISILVYMCLFLLIWYLYTIVKNIKNKKIRLICNIFYAVFILAVIYQIAYRSDYMTVMSELCYALAFLSSLYLLGSCRVDYNLKLLLICNLLVMVFNPLGSDFYVNFTSNCLTLSFSIILYAVNEVKPFQCSIVSDDKTRFEVTFSPCDIRRITKFTMGVIILLSVYNTLIGAYCDDGLRIYKTYEVHHPLAKDIYTTEKTAQIVDDLLSELNKYVSKDDRLLVYDALPIVNYLTQTRPYVPCAHVAYLFSEQLLDAKLSAAERNVEGLPVVLINKGNTWGGFHEPNENAVEKPMDKAMNRFLEKHHYTVAWENDYVMIMIPEGFSKKP